MNSIRRNGARLLDLSIFVILFLTLLNLLEINPGINWSVITSGIFISVFLRLVRKHILFRTPGERLWNFGAKTDPSALQTFFCAMINTVCLLLSLTAFDFVVLNHPLWKHSPTFKIPPFAPELGNGNQWEVLPFFYTFGKWPRRFDDKLISYQLNYEKGPPNRFVGNILMNWGKPHINVVIEGPKTPKGSNDFYEIKKCFQGYPPPSCWLKRETVLSRHLSEMKKLKLGEFQMNWFQVDDPQVPQDVQSQGIFLSARGLTSDQQEIVQSRFILINSKGTQETILLNRTTDEIGKQAWNVFQQIMGNLKLYSEVATGRAWVNRKLESTNVKELENQKNLVEIQGVLISRISVLPQDFESYFHLGGTSILSIRDPDANSGIPPAVALENIKNTYLYALDISPANPHTSELLRLRNEAETSVFRINDLH